MFTILLEVFLIQIQEEIHHFAGWEGGGLRGTKIVNKDFVNKLAFPKHSFLRKTSKTQRQQNTEFTKLSGVQTFQSPDLSGHFFDRLELLCECDWSD